MLSGLTYIIPSNSKAVAPSAKRSLNNDGSTSTIVVKYNTSFNSLTSICKDFNICNNNGILKIDAIENINTINGNVNISNNKIKNTPVFTNLFPSLNTIDSSSVVNIRNNTALNSSVIIKIGEELNNKLKNIYKGVNSVNVDYP